MAVAPLEAGDPRQLGEFAVVGRLGEGGQGVVYDGRSAGGERVAIKVLRNSSDPDARRWLAAELQAVRRVAPFCTARVLDASLEGPDPYVVSEFVDGPSLHDRVALRGPLRDGDLDRLAIGTASALAAIHAAGVIHRDFKPANVMLGPDGPRVVDFGIARQLDITSVTHGLVGTPKFMAPEQFNGKPASPASDIFAWGVTIAYAATGRSLFSGTSVAAIMFKIIESEPDLTDMPERLHLTIVACLAKDPALRPEARELLIGLVDPASNSTMRLAGARPLGPVGEATSTVPGDGPPPAPDRHPTPVRAQHAAPSPTHDPAQQPTRQATRNLTQDPYQQPTPPRPPAPAPPQARPHVRTLLDHSPPEPPARPGRRLPLAAVLALVLATVAVVVTVVIGNIATSTFTSGRGASPTGSVIGSPTGSLPAADAQPAGSGTPQDYAGNGKRVAVGGTLADGDIASGELRRAGQKDEFTLDLGDAREFYTADMTGDSIQIDVVNAGGETITVGGKILLQYETYPWALTRAGQHKIVIEGQEQDVIGPYSFRLATVKVRTYEVQIGQQIGGGTPPGAGSIDVPGVIERYEFDAAGANQVKLVGGPQSCGDVSFEIRDVSDTDNTSARSPVPFCAPESLPISLDDAGTGRYVLIVRHDHVRTAQYSFRIVRA